MNQTFIFFEVQHVNYFQGCGCQHFFVIIFWSQFMRYGNTWHIQHDGVKCICFKQQVFPSSRIIAFTVLAAVSKQLRRQHLCSEVINRSDFLTSYITVFMSPVQEILHQFGMIEKKNGPWHESIPWNHGTRWICCPFLPQKSPGFMAAPSLFWFFTLQLGKKAPPTFKPLEKKNGAPRFFLEGGTICDISLECCLLGFFFFLGGKPGGFLWGEDNVFFWNSIFQFFQRAAAFRVIVLPKFFSKIWVVGLRAMWMTGPAQLVNPVRLTSQTKNLVIFIYLEPQWLLFLKVNPPKTRPKLQ